tara:strand:+ start:1369 stop:1809 length:441 start_codon:yes stop_codon:yes gene_type:complete
METRLILVQDQVASMKATWPALKPRQETFESVKWVGNLRPQFQSYTICIVYRLAEAPVVKVLSPKLIRLPKNEEGQLPHVYPPANDPSLCLYDPAADEWDPSMLLSQSIVLWTLDWLSCYELWLMTGRWTGGGRHPSIGTEHEAIQ